MDNPPFMDAFPSIQPSHQFDQLQPPIDPSLPIDQQLDLLDSLYAATNGTSAFEPALFYPPPDVDVQNDEFVEELQLFNQFWESLLKILEPCEIGLLALGFVGNLVAFITLLRSKRMYTPSFLYHRALVGVDLLFCTNFFINLSMDRLGSVECKQQIFKYRFAAFYSASVNPLINSVCAYSLCYSTVAVTLDRFVALALFKSYQTWNRRRIAFAMIAANLFLSLTVHSWSTVVQNYVIESDLNDTSSSLVWEPCWDDQTVYHWVKRENLGDEFEMAAKIKRIYNAVFRIAYPFVLGFLTLGVICGLVRRNRRKRRLRRALSNGEGSQQRRQQPNHHHISPAARRRHRAEHSLFLLTIAVLVLAFLQVATSEGRRILQFAFPAAEIIKTKVNDEKLSMHERLDNFRWVLYAHQATRALANFFTVVERSAICFLYVATNKLFRGELVLMMVNLVTMCSRLFSSSRGPHGASSSASAGLLGDFRGRFDSDARNLRTTTNTSLSGNNNNCYATGGGGGSHSVITTSTSLLGRGGGGGGDGSPMKKTKRRASMNVVVRKFSDMRRGGSEVGLLIFGRKHRSEETR